MPLFDECQIDSLCIPQPYLYYDQEYSPAILQLLWTPLASQLYEGQTVYYVPSQLLFNIALSRFLLRMVRSWEITITLFVCRRLASWCG